MDCFLARQETSEELRKTQKPVTDFLVSGQLAQSASEKALSCKGVVEEEESDAKNNP